MMPAGENEIPRAGTYQEISPLDWIVFTCESPFSVDHSTMTLTFELVEKGTRVTLTYVRVNDAETRDNHKGGWVNILKAINASRIILELSTTLSSPAATTRTSCPMTVMLPATS